MYPAFAAVKDHLDRHEVNFEVDEEGVIVTGYTGETAKFEVFLEPDDEIGLLKVVVLHPALVPQSFRPAVLEFCNLVNNRHSLCRLMLNPEEGQPITEIVTAFEPGHLSDPVIGRCLRTCLFQCEVSFPSILSIVHGGLTAQAAMEKALAKAAEISDATPDAPPEPAQPS